eukprot:gene8687-27501_t
MPHGDFSDLAALVTLGAGLTAIWAPQYYYTDVGPMKAFFEGGDEAMSPNEATLLNLVGASLIFMFWALYSVRWNTVNGKAAAVGTATLATTCGRIAWKMDGGELVFRGWHVLMVLYVLTTLHLAFNANPMWTSTTLLAKEKEKAAKKAAKSK